jgi:type I restriction enzyme S subunit
MHRLHKDDFVLSQLKGWEGALTKVSSSYDGWFLSPQFCTFRAIADRLNIAYLDWYCKQSKVWDELKNTARGMGARRDSVSPERFLSLIIPLPPLSEQRRIVARIEELAAKINEARVYRQKAAEEADRLLASMAHRHDLNEDRKAAQGWRIVQLGDVIKHVDDSYRVQTDSSFPNLGIYSFGRGLFRKPPIDGALTSATSLRRVRKGQFIYSRLFAFEGAYGFVDDEFDGYFVSNEYPTFECDSKEVRVEFVAAYFKSPFVWKDVAAGSKGLGDRRQRVQPDQILSYDVWLPPMEWQNRIARIQAQVDPLKKFQAETAPELDAMLPSILDMAFKGEL